MRVGSRVNSNLPRILSGILIGALVAAIGSLPGSVAAQSPQATLVGRALLAASTLADGTPAGQSFASRKVINGLKVPFDSQPVGGFVAILPGPYNGAFYLLSNGTFDTAANSADYALRIYTVEVNWRTTNQSDGGVSLVDWLTLSDPANKAGKSIHNASAKTRELSGADFEPRAFQHMTDGTFWVAENIGPSLLHLNKSGQLMEAPVALGAGAVEGLALLGNTTLVVAQHSASDSLAVVLRNYDTSGHAFAASSTTFPREKSGDTLGGLTMLNDHQALIIEHDNGQGKAAAFKRVYLVDLTAKPMTKTLVLDLLSIADPSNISTAKDAAQAGDAFGVGAQFSYPYAGMSAVLAQGAQSLIVVNDNNVPFGLGRSPTQAAPADFILVQLAAPLP